MAYFDPRLTLCVFRAGLLPTAARLKTHQLATDPPATDGEPKSQQTLFDAMIVNLQCVLAFRLASSVSPPGETRSLPGTNFFVVVGILMTMNLGCERSVAPTTEVSAERAQPLIVRKEIPPVISDDTRQVATEIDVVNPLSTPLRITGISQSCGCLSTKLMARDLGPRERTTLRMTIGTRGYVGRRHVHCRLQTDRDLGLEYRVTVTAVKRIELNHYEWSFGSVPPSEKVIRHATLRAHAVGGRKAPRILEVTCQHEALQCEVEEDRVVAPDAGVSTREASLRLALSPQAEIGTGAAYVQVRY